MGRSRADSNNNFSIFAVSNGDGSTPVELWADPSTHALITSGGGGGGGGTQYAEQATTSPATGTLSLGRYQLSAPTLTDGQMFGLQLDSSGNLKVTGSLSVGGTTDNATFTAGSSTGTTALGFYHSVIDTVTDGHAAAVAITPKRGQHANLRDASGNELGISSAPLQVSLANTGANATKILVTPDANSGVNISQINGNTPLVLADNADSIAPTTTTDKQAILNRNTVFGATGNTWNRQKSIEHGINSSGVGHTSAGILAEFDDTSPTAITENQFGTVRMSANRNLYGTIRDAAGNERGVNVTAGNALTVDGSAVTQPVSLTSTTISGTVAVTESGTWTIGSSTATGSAVPANAFYNGVNAQTALPTAATAGNLTGATADKFGRSVVLPGTIRDLVGTQTTTISASTSETTVVTAAASVFNDLTALVLSNTSATATRVDFRDTTSGSVLFSIYVPAGDTRGIAFQRPIPQTSVNTNWTAQSSASITDLRVYAVFDKNK